MPRTGTCYNCGSGTPQQDDEKFLCDKCSTLYEFSPTGNMVVKRRPPEPGKEVRVWIVVTETLADNQIVSASREIVLRLSRNQTPEQTLDAILKRLAGQI